jgi:N-methylhydantoinase A/oxoprolinase/acetone carboxylase beta subunit
VRDEAVAMMAELVGNILHEGRIDAAETPLFAFGGNGPMFAAFVAEKLGMPAAYAFNLGPVFSAFGSAISDVVHSYERGLDLIWDDHAGNSLAPIVQAMRTQAARDLRGEGFEPVQARYTWELDFGLTESEITTVRAESADPQTEGVISALARAVDQARQSSQPLIALRLATRHAVGSFDIGRRTDRVATQHPGRREVRFTASARERVAVHRWEELNVGDVIDGPAIVNGATLTCPVPAGWRLNVDEYGNARLQRT